MSVEAAAHDRVKYMLTIKRNERSPSREIDAHNQRNAQSVRSAYLAKIKSLIGNDQAKKFDGFYGQRSKLLHEGTRPRDIG